MDETTLFRAIGTMRKHLPKEYEHDVDPMAQETRDEIEKLFELRFLGRRVHVVALGTDDTFGTAIMRLANTPRKLKHVLRRTDSLWKELHGEVSFDDLLVSTILRCVACEAFDFVLRRIDILRMCDNSGSDGVGGASQQVIQEDWKKTIRGAEWDVTAARRLIVFLFPEAAKCFGEDCYAEGEHESPQGVRNWEPTNYWDRILAGEVARDELHDQTVLKCMAEWSGSRSNCRLAVGLCSSERFVEVWKHFSKDWPVPRLLALSSKVLEILRNRDGARAGGERTWELGMALCERAHEAVGQSSESRDWLIDQVVRSVGTSLRLANSLYYFWGSIQYGVVTTEEDRNAVRQALVGEARKVFVDRDASALIRATDPEYPYSIWHLVHPADAKEPRSIVTEPSDWRWLAPILLDAASCTPAHMIPQIALLTTKSDFDSTWEVHTTWNEAFLNGMFGSHMSRLMQVLSMDFAMSPVPCDPAAPAKIDNARKLARQWLEEHADQSASDS